MKKITLGIIISAVCTALLIGIVITSRPPKLNDVSTNQDSTSYTVAEVGVHATQTDCWMIINGSVYDLTNYVKSHPGGNEILRGCGKDATTLFNSRRDGAERVGSGSPHSSSATSTLASFKIGTLTN